MNEIAARWRTVSEGFTRRVTATDEAGWDRPTPCEGWVARDVVVHLAGWVPPLLAAGAGVELAPGPDAATDPAGAWTTLAASITALLDDPGRAGTTFDHPQAGRHRLDEAIDRFITGDVLIHTWDLARATGGDETLDPDAVARMLPGLEAMGDALVASGHYGQPVPLDPDADPQSRLLAATGRDPR